MCLEFNLTKKIFANLCKKYSIIKNIKLRKEARIRESTYTKDEFIKKANEIHNNKYDYSKVNYIDSRLKISIICPEHGEFKQ